MTKVCNKCGIGQPLENFYRRSASKDGRAYSCKSCAKLANNEWREGHREVEREYSRDYREQHLDEMREATRQWFAAHRTERAAYVREWRRRRKEQQSKPPDPS